MFGGYGISLRTYYKTHPSDLIAEDFRLAIKGVEIELDKGTFISPITFA
ncbi:hypothetical protein FB479_102706 [Brevibacillus sp. AG162]|nr:hypothetical protein [Brevibacillus sp. AG162]TQK74066.1 hypothetical protein FB479_102706 [Brevibacillus sp. AG162]